METVKNLSFSRPPHQPKVETAKNQLFQDHHIHPNMETVKNLSSQDHHNQPKGETAKNQLFQDHHIHPKYGNC